MITDTHAATELSCELTDPGHQMHWARWKDVASADCVPVERTEVHGPEIVLVVGGQRLRWFHHDPERLAEAVRSTRAPVLACLDGQALRVEGYWFNCATESAFQPCA